MTVHNWLACTALAFGFASQALAQSTLTNEKRADIVAFLELTDALSFGQQLSQAFTSQMAGVIRAANPAASPELVDAMRGIVDEVITEELPRFADEVVQIYDRYFTHEEIRDFIEFYSSDLGRKATRVLPDLTQESMMIGQAWGQSLQPEIERRMRAWMQDQGVVP